MEKEIENQYKFILNLFADAVKKKRKVSIKELSEQSGVSTAVISDFENKKYMPKIEILLRLFHVLNIKLHDLVENKEIEEKIKNKTAKMLTYEESIKNYYTLIATFLHSLGLSATETQEVLSYIKFKAHDKIDTSQIYK